VELDLGHERGRNLLNSGYLAHAVVGTHSGVRPLTCGVAGRDAGFPLSLLYPHLRISTTLFLSNSLSCNRTLAGGDRMQFDQLKRRDLGQRHGIAGFGVDAHRVQCC
jgi:hypothetical protein